MYEFLGIDIKILDDFGFQFFQTVLTLKVLEDTGMDHCNGFPTPTKVEATLGTYEHGSEAKRYWTNFYDYVIGVLLYLSSNKRPYIYCAVHHCSQFINNTKESHEMAMKMICWYIQVTKDKVLVFNLSKKLVADCYADADFAGL